MRCEPWRRLTGPLLVSVPQGSWAAGLQREECDYLQMIEVQHKQCLEEAQLENETAGEAPGGKRGAADPQGVPFFLTS